VLLFIVLWHAVAHREGMFSLPRRALLAPQPLVPCWGPAVLPAAHSAPPCPRHYPQRRLCKVAAGIEKITGEVRSHCGVASLRASSTSGKSRLSLRYLCTFGGYLSKHRTARGVSTGVPLNWADCRSSQRAGLASTCCAAGHSARACNSLCAYERRALALLWLALDTLRLPGHTLV